MAYEKPITIKEAITAIQDQEFILPSIQREFVWGTYQIETLFDSLMRDYPISTFLFWKVKSENIDKFKFYRFLKDYHQRDNKHNQPADISSEKDRIAILDGQQRLTSLYIGLKGSDSRKLPKYQWSSDYAFPTKKLYVNLLEKSSDSDREYDFQFLSEDDLNWYEHETEKKYFWFRVGDVLGFKDITEVMQFLVKNKLMDSSLWTQNEIDFSMNTLSKLFKVICENETINFFLEKSEELDKVLQIFIRINSGGTKLSYSDLLLSIATAQWKKKDARKIIHEFVDKINAIGGGYSFNKDIVLKSCLVLSNIKDIRFHVDNFSSENMSKIEDEWDDISSAITSTIKLIYHFGFNNKALTANNAIIPIAYFIKKRGISESNLLNHSSQENNRKLIKEWLIRALLKKVFGGTPDSLYPVYRNIINQNEGDFPLEALIERYKGSNKSLEFYEDNIEHLLTTNYGSSFAFMVLSLIYPLKGSYEFHQDHMHPKTFFTHKKLEKFGIETFDEREAYISRYNSLPNLQLIEAVENKQKNAKKLDVWLDEAYPSEQEQLAFKHMHFFPVDESVTFSNFVNFYDARRELLKQKLIKILNVKIVETETINNIPN
ncbi:hypothetical protein GCM10011344_15060 [Dokdonia pacifica]|uniref:Uncharacterized conserved protein, contains ParB-like and HNH nuclease domains n=1 Tax=Dokdonia pacifica TaxID=1627892 RepID=A0A238W2R0_9FLAO|nr:DUF262 domain-containing protein [Dokdonia pacifica]GGG15490.1 hypothetical protein GCM10011344_15060 [Dokdonia pacifica]SNR40842.1 Uncharacterized conserved protein, contains ParB-like and HNH nuclease domains [Dokdonia pacifica]